MLAFHESDRLGFDDVGLHSVVDLHADAFHPGLALRDQHRALGECRLVVGEGGQRIRGGGEFLVLSGRRAMNPHVAGQIDLVVVVAQAAAVGADRDRRLAVLAVLVHEVGTGEVGRVVVRIVADVGGAQRVLELAVLVELAQDVLGVAAQGFDVGTIVVNALRRSMEQSIPFTEALNNLPQLDGVTGTISVRPDGELERVLRVVEVLKDGMLELSPQGEPQQPYKEAYIYRGNESVAAYNDPNVGQNGSMNGQAH